MCFAHKLKGNVFFEGFFMRRIRHVLTAALLFFIVLLVVIISINLKFSFKSINLVRLNFVSAKIDFHSKSNIPQKEIAEVEHYSNQYKKYAEWSVRIENAIRDSMAKEKIFNRVTIDELTTLKGKYSIQFSKNYNEFLV